MALVLADRVQETTATTGTGSLTLAGAVSGFQSFAVVGNTNTCYYTIVDGTAWEVGVGTYSTTGPTLARTTVLSNSSGNTSPLTLAAGSKPVFLTYPAERSVNLDASGNVSALGTVSSGTWQGSTVGVAYGGTGVTASSGASSVVLRDANQNIVFNNYVAGFTATTASAGTTVLTVASTRNQILTGSTTHTFQMPNATTLQLGQSFLFVNNSSGVLTITNNASAVLESIPAGGVTQLGATSIATSAGTFGIYSFLPGTYDFSNTAATFNGAAISSAVWNGTTISTAYGGTGLSGATPFTSGGAVYASSASALTSGTLPVSAGGTGAVTLTGYVKGTGTAALTASSTIPNTDISGLGTMSTQAASAVAITGGTINGTTVGATTAATVRGTTITATTQVDYAGSTSGTTTLKAAAVAGATTITMPATTGTMALTSDLPTVNNGTLTLAVSGTGLSGSQTFTANQSSAATFTVASNATSANTASTIVARDGSGNFTAGTITAALAGNASTATSATSATTATTATTATNQSGGTLNATTGTVTPNTTGVSTGFNVVNGDITTYRTGGTTGVVYLSNSGSRYLYYDGTNYNLNGGAVIATNITAAGNVTGSSASCTGNAATASNVAGLVQNSYTSYANTATTTAKNSYYGLLMGSSTSHLQIMADGSGNGGFYREANGTWPIYYLVSNGCVGIGTSTTNSAYGAYVAKGLYADGLIRAGTNFYADQNYGYGAIGLYNSTIFQGLFAMGDAYKLTAGGAINNLYGMTWSYPSAGGIAGNLSSHGMIVAINGGFGSCMSYNVTASGNVTAYSDERLKKNWEPLCDNFIEKLAKVKVGTYERIDQPVVQVGVSAQSLEKVLPEAVTTSNDEMQTKQVSYGNAALASAVMLAQEVVELKQMMKQLQAELAELKRGM